jgi:hypothetical protein
MRLTRPSRLAVAAVLAASGCTSATPVYPPRPPESPGEPVADPTPSRITVHATLTRDGLTKALEDAVPTSGDGTFPALGKDRAYSWTRRPFVVSFRQGRIGLALHVDGRVELPISHLDVPIDLEVLAEPVVSSSYVAKLQSVDVTVKPGDAKTKLADAIASVSEKMRNAIQAKIADVSFDLRPLVEEAYLRVEKPIELPLGDAHGCADLRVLGVEAGPTVLADGIEKDVALIVAPSITLPCAAEPPPPLPPLANVASLTPGPFTISLPIAARYEELARAMSLAFTDGKLFFSKEFPELYMENPEVYAGRDQLVLKLHIKGPVHKFGGDHDLDGDLYMTGHPTVEDNELRVPDLEPTIETSSFLLKLKAMVDASQIRDQARAALRLDIGERLRAVRSKLSTDLAFANGAGCLQAEVSKVEVTGVHAHAGYLRLYATATARASAYVPCPAGVAPPTEAGPPAP